MKRLGGVFLGLALLGVAVTTWVVVGDAWWQLRQAEAVYLKRDFPAAVDRLRPAIVQAEQSYLPRTLRPRKMVAHALIEQAKFDDAALEYKKILLFDTNDYTANFALGMLAWQSRSFAEAETKLGLAQACNCPSVEVYRNAVIALRDAQTIERDVKRLAAEADKENKKIIEDMLSDAWLLLIPKVGWVAKGVVVSKGAWKLVWKWFKPNPEVLALEKRLAAAVKVQEESWKKFLEAPL